MRRSLIGQPLSCRICPIVAAGPFYAAEDYHQDYYKHNAVRYKFYRHHCGRDKRLQEVWGASPPH
jgi:peptide-methionine (S)-S-oxide reductase